MIGQLIPYGDWMLIFQNLFRKKSIGKSTVLVNDYVVPTRGSYTLFTTIFTTIRSIFLYSFLSFSFKAHSSVLSVVIPYSLLESSKLNRH
jgi:hypothetical protein